MSGRNDNNPFSEPEDDDHTIIVPREALSALSARRLNRDDTDHAAPTAGGMAAPPGEAIDFSAIPPVGDGPVVQAAQPLLALMARLRNVVSVPDSGALRERTVLELRRFETVLREAKVPPEHLRLGHYALCTSLDDVVQCTPWGSHGPWAQISLTSAFHKDVRGGERFFEILGKLLASPSRYLSLIELMYLCMSLGMQGRYRLSPRGPAELDRLREETYAAIRSLRDAPPADLSPRWRGLAAPFRPLRFEIPIWLAALITAGVLALAYALVLFSLADGTDRVANTAQSLPPLNMPVLQRPNPGPPPVVPEVAGLRTQLLNQLAADIRSGRISVAGTEMVPILRLQSDGMFALGQASIEQRFVPTLEHIADVLSKVNGTVRIIGYTDSQPIHTLAFPSNFDLSRARAKAAAAVIGEKVDPSHIVTAGRGAEAPCASNATEAGRRANRRVEIIVESAGPN